MQPGTGSAPSATVAGSIWVKTTAVGGGANVVVNTIQQAQVNGQQFQHLYMLMMTMLLQP